MCNLYLCRKVVRTSHGNGSSTFITVKPALINLCHKLSRDHVWLTSYTRMRVYLAAQVCLNYVYMYVCESLVLACSCLSLLMQVMSESVACALEVLDEESTRETRLFIRMIDRFFDYLNVNSPLAKEGCYCSIQEGK